MADERYEPSATPAKRKALGEPLLGRSKQLKFANPSASQPNSTWVSFSSPPGAHHAGPGNYIESVEPTASGMSIDAIFVSYTMTQPTSLDESSNAGLELESDYK